MKDRDARKFNKLRIEFLPEALEIVEKPVAPLGHVIIWSVFLVLLIFILWACFGKVDEVTTARGQITSEDGVQEIQAMGTGIITKVYVSEGEAVKKGDLIYSIDKEVEKLDIDYSQGEIGLLELRVELLNQMLLGKDIAQYRDGQYSAEQLDIIEEMIVMNQSLELSVEGYEIALENAKNQYKLAETTVETNDYTAEYFKEQQTLQEETYGLKNTVSIELEALEENYEYAKKEADKYKTLYEAGALAKNEWEKKCNEAANLEKQIEIKEVELQDSELTKQGEQSNLNYQINENNTNSIVKQGSVEESKANYDTALLNLENAKKQRDSTLLEQKEQCVDKLKEYGVTLTQQYYEYEQKDIIAPYDGVIKTLNYGKEGSVVTSTQPVAEILPDTEQLIVEAEVSNKDIGFVEIGQEVNVKVDTYDYQKYGMLTGVVIYISPDAIENEKLEKIYKVQILLGNDTDKPELTQGMECSVEIKTGRRHIIEFFLEPLTEALDNSMKER